MHVLAGIDVLERVYRSSVRQPDLEHPHELGRNLAAGQIHEGLPFRCVVLSDFAGRILSDAHQLIVRRVAFHHKTGVLLVAPLRVGATPRLHQP